MRRCAVFATCAEQLAGVSIGTVEAWKRRLGLTKYDHYTDAEVLQAVKDVLDTLPAIGLNDGYRHVRAWAGLQGLVLTTPKVHGALLSRGIHIGMKRVGAALRRLQPELVNARFNWLTISSCLFVVRFRPHLHAGRIPRRQQSWRYFNDTWCVDANHKLFSGCTSLAASMAREDAHVFACWR